MGLITWDEIRAVIERQRWLGDNMPLCPKCGEAVQLQIKRIDAPALWRCRKCEHHFEKEPQPHGSIIQ
jgi:ribosomal protein L37AE/L43A